jgi:hypothetical protein
MSLGRKLIYSGWLEEMEGKREEMRGSRGTGVDLDSREGEEKSKGEQGLYFSR